MQKSKSILELRQLRESAINNIFPHKIVHLEELEYAGENCFKLGGVEMIADERVSNKFDALANVSDKQKKLVKNISGETGLNNFRNFMSVASSAETMPRVALFANPHTQTLIDIVPLKGEYIAAALFFDFIETIINSGNYEVVKWEYSHNIHEGITLFLNPQKPTIRKIAANEEFITDGIYLKWNVASVSAGNWFTRLICENGMTRDVRERADNRVYALNPKTVNYLTDNVIAKLAAGFDSFQENILNAASTSASLAENSFAFNLLKNNELDVKQANEIVPYTTMMEGLKDKNANQRNIKTPFSIWEIYNRLTDFASHNTVWEDSDPRRSKIIFQSAHLLTKKPDIVNYTELEFAE